MAHTKSISNKESLSNTAEQSVHQASLLTMPTKIGVETPGGDLVPSEASNKFDIKITRFYLLNKLFA